MHENKMNEIFYVNIKKLHLNFDWGMTSNTSHSSMITPCG